MVTGDSTTMVTASVTPSLMVSVIDNHCTAGDRHT